MFWWLIRYSTYLLLLQMNCHGLAVITNGIRKIVFRWVIEAVRFLKNILIFYINKISKEVKRKYDMFFL